MRQKLILLPSTCLICHLTVGSVAPLGLLGGDVERLVAWHASNWEGTARRSTSTRRLHHGTRRTLTQNWRAPHAWCRSVECCFKARVRSNVFVVASSARLWCSVVAVVPWCPNEQPRTPRPRKTQVACDSGYNYERNKKCSGWPEKL